MVTVLHQVGLIVWPLNRHRTELHPSYMLPAKQMLRNLKIDICTVAL